VGITSVGTPARIRSWTLGIRVNVRFAAKSTSSRSCGGCALAISGGKIHQSGGFQSKSAPPLFLCSFHEVDYLDRELGATRLGGELPLWFRKSSFRCSGFSETASMFLRVFWRASNQILVLRSPL
jgi:hypothetical protein